MLLSCRLRTRVGRLALRSLLLRPLRLPRLLLRRNPSLEPFSRRLRPRLRRLELLSLVLRTSGLSSLHFRCSRRLRPRLRRLVLLSLVLRTLALSRPRMSRLLQSKRRNGAPASS